MSHLLVGIQRLEEVACSPFIFGQFLLSCFLRSHCKQWCLKSRQWQWAVCWDRKLNTASKIFARSSLVAFVQTWHMEDNDRSAPTSVSFLCVWKNSLKTKARESEGKFTPFSTGLSLLLACMPDRSSPGTNEHTRQRKDW